MDIKKIKNAIIYNSSGIDLIRNRKLKEIISPSSIKLHSGEPVFICDREKVHGIVILNKPNCLTEDFFKSHFSRHFITEDSKEDMWSKVKKFNSHTFRIKKIFKDPLEYKHVNQEEANMSEFLKNIKVVDKVKEFKDYNDCKIAEYRSSLETLKGLKYNSDKELLKDLFLNLFGLMIDRMEKRHLTQCPDGFIYDPKTLSCVKIKPKNQHGKKPKKDKKKNMELTNA